MKNIYNSLLVVLLTLVTFSCSKEEVQNNEGLSAEELAFELKNDIDFNEIISKNADFSSLLINKLQNYKIENTVCRKCINGIVSWSNYNIKPF